jgi:hypothetical protein
VRQNLIGIGLSVIGCECVTCLTASFVAVITLLVIFTTWDMFEEIVGIEVEIETIVQKAYNSPAHFFKFHFKKFPKPRVHEVMEFRGYL